MASPKNPKAISYKTSKTTSTKVSTPKASTPKATTSSGFTPSQVAFVTSLQSKTPSKVTTTPSPTKTLYNSAQPQNQANSSNAPYAATQNTGAKTVGATQVRGNQVTNNPQAKPEQFTYATTKSGNTFVIPSNLSLQQREAYAKLGVSTSSQPPTNASWATDADTQIIVDTQLANAELDAGTDWLKPLRDLFTPPTTETPPTFDNDIPRIEDKADNPIADGVQWLANTLFGLPNGEGAADTTDATTVTADQNWAVGEKLTGNGDPLSILSQQEQLDYLQWLTQRNQEIVPTTSYDAFAANGKGTGSAALDSGFDNLKGSFGNILSSKWMPFIIIGIVGIIVLSYLKPKASGGAGTGGGSGTKVIVT